jgi:uncharacterized protein
MFRLVFTRRDVDHLLAAALLHDIGQYPFAHTIEDLRELGERVHDERLKAIRHDHELAGDVLKAPDRRGTSIQRILEANGFALAAVIHCIHNQPGVAPVPPAWRVSHDLIAQVLDLDRIAYLLQDSERSGVPYGNAVDVESLLDALTIHGTYADLAQKPRQG